MAVTEFAQALMSRQKERSGGPKHSSGEFSSNMFARLTNLRKKQCYSHVQLKG
jgi:hypothetical protein